MSAGTISHFAHGTAPRRPARAATANAAAPTSAAAAASTKSDASRPGASRTIPTISPATQKTITAAPSSACLPIARQVVALQPARQAVEAGEEDALGDIREVELVAHLPLQLSGDDDAVPQLGVRREPRVERDVGLRQEREQGVLVHDPRVERRRLDEERELSELLERFDASDLVLQQLGREDVGAFALEQRPETLRQELVHPGEIDAPDGAVPVEARRMCGCEVQRDVRRERPVEHSRRQAVVLPERQPVPDGVDRNGVARGVLAERAQDVPLELTRVAAEPRDARAQVFLRVTAPAKRVARAMPPETLVPGLSEQTLLQLDPRRDANVVHAARRSRNTSW